MEHIQGSSNYEEAVLGMAGVSLIYNSYNFVEGGVDKCKNGGTEIDKLGCVVAEVGELRGGLQLVARRCNGVRQLFSLLVCLFSGLL